ncbi:PLD nuclease N-terminal domain-containing protein [Streptomyces sp. YIM 98790]|uniref:PLD nuclease N-terminal domain-containing protein n=1 Tax=Streptomyces sp. YIM 98790 TaxID=2689077 RepID=UPI00140C7E75|nr:PLD nuclease N-terminal domain-containing protein [Streptomyces sp. YIM 98790]
MLRVLMFLVPLALAIYALVDCISTKDDEVRHLPKIVWILLIVFAWIIGPVAWIMAGRRRTFAGGEGGGLAGRGGGGIGRGRQTRWVAPDDNPEFLRSLDDGRSPKESEEDRELLESWEEDLRRREEELRHNEPRNDDDGGGTGGSGDEPRPPKS